MTREETYFIQMSGAAVSGRPVPPPDKIDWNRLYALFTAQDLRALSFPFLNGHCPDKALLQDWETAFYNISCQMANYEFETERLLSALEEAGIRHCLIKGYVLRNYYPYRDMRTMGDVDLLVDQASLEQAYQVFTTLGFCRTNQIAYEHTYQKGALTYEVHTRLIFARLGTKIDCAEYFDSWQTHMTQSARGAMTYELEPDFHILYLLVHLAKHFYFGGFGLRMLLDIYVFLGRFPNLPWDSINRQLREMRLDLFAGYVSAFLERWYSVKIPGVPTVEPSKLDLFTQNMLDGSTFFSTKDEEKREIHARRVALSQLFRILFPSFDHMAVNHSYIEKRPYLLPVAWLHRFGTVMFCRKTSIPQASHTIKNLSAMDSETQLQLAFAKKLGLPH